MKKNIILAAILLAAAVMATSCARELQPDNSIIPSNNGTFTGVIDQFGATKTALNSSHSVEWESTDVVRINDGFFSVDPDAANATKADFSFNGDGTEPTIGPYTAYYPSTLYDGSKLTLPETQTYAEGKITNNPMYAASETNSLSFHNLCGLVEFTFKGTATISKIVVTADAGGLSGDFTVTENKAVLTSDAQIANKGVTLDCGAGVNLNETDGVKFWIAIPAGTYKLTFTAIDTDGKVFQKITKAGVAVAANNIYAFNQTPTFTGDGYLCFTAVEAGAAVTLCKQGNPATNALEYMTVIGGISSSWTGLTYDTALPALTNIGDKVYIRAKEARTIAQDFSNYVYFSIDKQVDVSGNIMYLLDPTGTATTVSTSCGFLYLFKGCASLKKADQLALPATTLVQNSYSYMFFGCTGLTAAPELPATALAEYCYCSMFEGCTALDTAPALSATILAGDCYANMFRGCTNLATAPALDATTLAENCYASMFEGCTALETAPELSATTLADNCYSGMFQGCTSLAAAPALPAMTLESNCYQDMFYGCTSLTAAPALPATELAGCCYQGMFCGCTNLASITCHATDISADNCTFNWVNGVSSTGLIKVAKGMKTTWQEITSEGSGIPVGWFVEELIPFSVSAEKQVLFSKGNLWTNTEAKPQTWSFEENQYDCWSKEYIEDNHITLFFYDQAYGYGSTSGGESGVFSVDWGVPYCEANGLLAGTWRTPTKDEWQYLLFTRIASTVCGTANARYAKVKVNGGNGLLIFPDEFSWTESMGTPPSNCNVTDTSWSEVPSYTKEQFSVMESAGCVFLPTAGYRSNNKIATNSNVRYCYYWSSTPNGENYSYRMQAYGSTVELYTISVRNIANSVRLVADVNF